MDMYKDDEILDPVGEFEYRRGYGDGFEAAIESLQEHLDEGNIDIGRLLEKYWDFRWSKLKTWAGKRLDFFYLPPRPKI